MLKLQYGDRKLKIVLHSLFSLGDENSRVENAGGKSSSISVGSPSENPGLGRDFEERDPWSFDLKQ